MPSCTHSVFRRSALVFALVGLLLGATVAAAESRLDPFSERLEEVAGSEFGTATERFTEFIQLQYEAALVEFPEFATSIGVEGDHGRWTDGSFEAQARRQAFDRQSLETLESIPRDEIDESERLNYDLFLNDLRLEVKGQRFPAELLAISQLGGVQQSVARMLAIMPAQTVSQYEDILSRLRGVPKLVDDTIEHLEKGLEEGVTPPRITLRAIPDQIQNLIVDEPLSSPVLSVFQSMPESVAADEAERLRTAASKVYSESIRPAYAELKRYVQEEYLPGCRESIGLSELPHGLEWYAHNARRFTTTEHTPEEIHEIGMKEVQRIRAEMERVIEESGFEGTFDEFTEFLRTDPSFYYTDADALLAGYRDISKRADMELPRFFGLLPRLTYGVVPVPEFIAPSQTTAYYQRGSVDAGRPGKFFANTHALDTRPKWEMEALTLHEAVPGHHFQIALQQELDLPWFRRFGGYTAYVEGWGLYAESLGEEMGFYTDPYSKFGQLTYEMWRAIRLVVDTGMHALGWSRDQAIQFFTANTGKSEHDIVVEVDRYIVWPGQALGYKMGELKLQELRARAEETLGEGFDIRGFHDTVLGAGALPLNVLETKIDAWIESERAGG